MTDKQKQKQLSQWFTESLVAEAMWERAKLHNPRTLLEPSAGTGSLLLPVDEHVRITAVEIDTELCDNYLSQLDPPIHTLYNADYTKIYAHLVADKEAGNAEGPWAFDVGITNPPFEGGLDLAFIIQTFALCERVIALTRVQFMHRTACWRELWSRPDVCVEWRADCVPRPKFGGAYNPMDEYVTFEISHGPQRADIKFARIVAPKYLVVKT
jgi:16S rRNA A1518/A1519 N6-dimethyltransferase RsmA/KsgA/DIM1 with predicted DNA glycosylase/AP lyase activity